MPLAPPVGIVVANHNNGAFVEKAIESVACQTVGDLRVVVVDDASTDSSDDAIRRCLSRLNDGRFRYVKLETNLGQAGALRRGMAELDTPFVCFLDSDDVWYDGFVARHLAVHMNGDFPVALTYCDSHIIDADDRMLAGTAWWFDANEPDAKFRRTVDPSLTPAIDPPTGQLTYPPHPGVTFHPLWSPAAATNTTASMMLRRSFVDLVLVPSNDELRLYVDYYLSTFACLLTGAMAIHEPLYAYRMHGRNRHSNATVPGGAYNSSMRDWEPIRNHVLQIVQKVLRSEADTLRLTFGDERHGIAEALVADVVGVLPGDERAAAPLGRLAEMVLYLLGGGLTRLGLRNRP
jgi:glycosyltransferase involved in cell wall biosynthesis